MNRLIREPRVYGNAVPRPAASTFGHLDVISAPEVSLTGNIVLRVGKVIPGIGWEQILHVVMTPEEAMEFVGEIQEAVAVRPAFGEAR